jgi:phosphoribosylglycinamide formyltransferase 1
VRTLRLVVLLSGGGRTLLNLLEAIAAGRLDARVVRVISSRGDAAGVERARRAGLAVDVLRPRDFPDRAAFDASLAAALRAGRPDLVILAGWLLRVAVPPELAGRVLNIHPALLPRHGGQGMYGEHVHAAVLAAGDAESGCTVHLVDEQYDHGRVLAQERVPVLRDDTPETLAARVFEAECRTYPAAIAAFGATLPELPSG